MALPAAEPVRSAPIQFVYDCGQLIGKAIGALCEKIAQFVRKIFEFIGLVKPAVFPLNEEQVRIIARFKEHPERFPPLPPPNVNPAPQAAPQLPVVTVWATRAEQVKHEAYLEHMKGFVHSLTERIGKAVYDLHVLPAITKLQLAAQALPDQMRTAFKTIQNLGDTFDKPLFKKIRENHGKSTWTPEMAQFLVWAIGPRGSDSSAALYKHLTTIIPIKVKIEKIPHGRTIIDYSAQVLGIIFNSESSTMAEAFKDQTLDSHILQKVFETAILELYQAKVDFIINTIDELIQTKLPELAEEMLQHNLLKIADQMAMRIADLLKNIGDEEPNVGNANYIAMFDKIMEKVNEQAIAYAAAEKATGEKVEQAFLMHFRSSDICHANTRYKILPQEPQRQISVEEHLKKVDYIIYGELTKEILNIFVPPLHMIVGGRPTEIDGIRIWIQNVELQPLFYTLFEELKRASHEIVTPETSLLADKVKEPLLILLEKFTVSNIQNMATEGVRNSLRSVNKLMSNRDELDPFLGERIFPVMVDKMIYIIGSEMMRNSFYETAPLFKDILLNKNPGEALGKMIKYLHDKIQKYCLQSKSEIPLHSFEKIMLPLIDEIILLLKHVRGAPGRNHELETAEINAILDDYYKSRYKADNPLYAQLVINVVFRLGNFGNVLENLLSIKSLQSMISATAVASLKRLRTSPNQTILSLLGVCERRYRTEDDIRALIIQKENIDSLEDREAGYLQVLGDLEKIEGKNPYQNNKKEKIQKSLEEVREKLKTLRETEAKEPAILKQKREEMFRQLDKLSRLAYDLIIFHGGSVAKVAMGSDHTHLRKVIETCLHKFFGNPILTQNLLFQIQDVVFDTLKKSAQRVRVSQ